MASRPGEQAPLKVASSCGCAPSLMSAMDVRLLPMEDRHVDSTEPGVLVGSLRPARPLYLPVGPGDRRLAM